MAWAKTKSKYNAAKIVVDGVTFDSRKEGRRYGELALLQRAGEISKLDLQVRIALVGERGPILTPTGRQMSYVADFKYLDMNTGKWVLEDVKGYATPVYLIKKAVLAAMGYFIHET